MSATDEQHKALSTLYVCRFRSKKYLSLAVEVSGKPEKSQEKSRKAHDKNKQYIIKNSTHLA